MNDSTSEPPVASRRRGWLLPVRVRWMVVLAVLVGLAVAMVASVALERTLGRERARAELERDLARTTRVLALTMQGQLWDYARDSAEDTVRAMVADDRRVVSVTVIDQATGRPFVEFLAPEAVSAVDLAQRSEVLSAANGEMIGRVDVAMSVRPYLDAAAAAMWRAAGMSIVMLGLGGMLILALLQRRLLLPMEALVAAARGLSTGDLRHPIVARQDDEVGAVAAALEAMRVALLAAFDDLQAKNRELTAQSAQLEARVIERTAAFSQANDELRDALVALKNTESGLMEAEKLASLGKLVAGVAHELNTPLGNAVTVVTTLEDLLADVSGRIAGGNLRRADLDHYLADTREGQEILHRNVTKAADLVRGLKQLAVDQTTDMRRQFNLAEVVDEVLIMVRPRFNHTPFRIDCDVAALVLDSYPGPLGQVITNLVLNALTHGFDGRDQGCVTIRASRQDDARVLLVVKDDGVGMTPEVRRRLFEPFFTTRLGQGGSGLGLHIARNIVMGLLGGTIEAVSEPAQGAEFRITLPVVAPTPVQG